MPFIGSRMHGNSICSEALNIFRRFNNIRIIATTRVPECCKFIDIYGQFSSIHTIKIIECALILCRLIMIKFSAILLQFAEQGEKTGWTYIQVPVEITQKLKPGNKRSFKVKGY